MRLGIDLDGVVADFTSGWMRFYNAQFDTNLVYEDSQRWNDVVDLTHFNHMDEFWEWASDLDGRSVFWHLEPYPGAVDALHALEAEGHEVVVITHKPDFAVADTHEWLDLHGIPTSERNICALAEPKWAIECDIYLDDGPHVLPGLVAHRPDRIVSRYVRPWNRPVAGALDVHNFDEFRDVVRDATST